MSAVLYHPGIKQTIVVPPDAVPHYRMSGWLLASEHEANEAAAAQAAEDAKADTKAAAKQPTTREEK